MTPSDQLHSADELAHQAPPLRVRSDDPDYQRQSAAEAAFWRAIHPDGMEAMERLQLPGPIDRYINRRFTGDQHTPWYHHFGRGRTFRRGACLGTSSLTIEAGILTSNPALHLTFFELSAGAAERRQTALGSRFPGRVATQVADLNFLTLPRRGFDLIVSSSTVHHVTNLEHLAWQINDALTDEGYCFLEDYVGEPRFQFSGEKQRVYREIFNRDRARRGAPPSDLVWLDDSDLSPFCGVRSDQILEVFRTYLLEKDVRTAGALTVPILRSRPEHDGSESPWAGDRWVRSGARWRLLRDVVRSRLLRRRPSSQGLLADSFLDDLYHFGDVLTAAGLLRPGLAFATYQRRGAVTGGAPPPARAPSTV